MTNPPLSLDDFISKIEELFGQPLTAPASEAAADFWRHWSSFSDLISERALSVHVDALRLGMNFPQYKRNHVWKGAGTTALILGVLVVLWVWEIGALLLAAGFVLHIVGDRIKHNDAKEFAEGLMKGAELRPDEDGYPALCAHYIAGIVELASPHGAAHWPQFPSDVVTGEQTRIAT